MSGDPGIFLAPKEELVCVQCTTVNLLSPSVFNISSEAANSVRPMVWEMGVTVSSVSEAGIGLDCDAGLLSLDIF